VNAAEEDALASAIAKATRRLVWFLVVLYFFAVLDRVNVGVAGITMRRDLGLTAGDFGFGAGIFFLGYLIFEVPSNLALERFGARVWLARIVVTWGLASMATALAVGPSSFTGFRFLLGVAEAGFFPGVLFYLTLWFPARQRARVNALFFLGVPLSNAMAAALSSVLLTLNGTLGLAGWQWLFIVEGAPPVLLGLLALRLLPSRPSDAAWLTPSECQALNAKLEQERGARGMTVRDTLRSPIIWVLGCAYFGVNVSLTTLGLWLPQVVGSLGKFTPLEAGLVSAGVLLPGALAMFLWSRHSDRVGERVAHTIAAALLAAAGWALYAASNSPAVSIALLTLASAGTYASVSVFWTYPAALLSGRAAAGGIALIGAIGNLGGFVGPWVIGDLHDRTGGFSAGFLFVALTLLLTAGIAWRVGRRVFPRHGAAHG